MHQVLSILDENLKGSHRCKDRGDLVSECVCGQGIQGNTRLRVQNRNGFSGIPRIITLIACVNEPRKNISCIPGTCLYEANYTLLRHSKGSCPFEDDVS